MLLVNEAVRLHRNGLITVAPIWEKYLTTQSYRTGFVEEVTNSVDVLLEYLVNEYLKANQKS